MRFFTKKGRVFMNNKFCLFVAVIFIALGGISSFAQENKPNAAEVLQHYKESLSYLQSVSMKVVVKTSQDEAIGADVNSTIMREFHFVHRRDGKRCEWIGESLFVDSNGIVNRAGSHIIKKIFTGEEYVEVIGPLDGPPWAASIHKDPQNEVKDLYEAPILAGPLSGGIYASNHKSIAELLNDSENLHLRQEMENIGGIPCYVLEATTKYGKVTAWVAPDRGYNALKLVMEKLSSSAPETESWIWIATLDSVDVQKIDDIFVPVAGHFTHKSRKSDGRVITSHFKYERSEIELHPDFKAIGAFVPDIPDGTKVHVKEAPGIRYVWKGGKITPVDDPTFEEIDKTVDNLKKGKQAGN
jgi:hypothetical protein